MAWTEQDYQEIVARLKRESQGVGDVPTAESLDGITSLPAYQPAEGQDVPRIVRAPLALLATPALEAARVANEAATLANEKAGAADEAARTANAAASGLQEIIRNADTATGSANSAAESANRAASGADTAAGLANEKAALADTAATNANDTANHPTYIGTDHYVYKWNKATGAYDKTDIYCKGDAFTVKKVYVSVAAMEADKDNPDIAEGDFVLVNTGDVEDPDNAKLYVKHDGEYGFLVDMSGAIGFTGKTPQFSIGTVSTLEAGASATATVSEDGTDEGGNPKYKINFAIPRGNPGVPFRPVGQFDTLELLKQSIPDGSNVEGMIAVGAEKPYDYYAWLNGDWVNQGKIEGVTEAPTDGKTYARKSGDWVESVEKKDVPAIIDEKTRFGYVLKEYTIDASALDENTWYPVTIKLHPGGYLANVRMEIHVALNTNKPSWATHQNGFTVDLIWESNSSDWGRTAVYRRVIRMWHGWTEINPVRGIGQMTQSGYEYVYVRGGGIYKFFTSHDCVPVLRTSTFQVNEQSVAPTTSFPAEIVRNVALTDDLTPLKTDISKRTRYYDLGTTDLNSFGSDESFIGMQYLNANATLERHYPIQEAGMFIAAGGIYGRTNQIYTTYNTNKIFIRGAGSNSFTEWEELGKIGTISLSNIDNILTNVELSGSNATQKIVDIFGAVQAFANLTVSIRDARKKYYFVIGINRIELGSVYAWTDGTSYALMFVCNYTDSNTFYTKRCSFIYNSSNTNLNKAIVEDLVHSDNITTLTKKSSSEYNSLTQDANTMYAVVD